MRKNGKVSVFEGIKVISEYEEPEQIAAKLEQMQDPDFVGSVSNDTTVERRAKGIFEARNFS